MMTRRDKVFISYRREDSEDVAKLLAEELQKALPNIDVFLDLEGIELGTDWSDRIFTQLMDSNAVLALIGTRWLSAFRRRTASTDVMLREIEWAFSRKRAVLPVLVHGAKMPSPQEMPTSIAQLCRIQALTLQKSTLDTDMKRLADRVSRLVREYGDHYDNWILESDQTPAARSSSSIAGKWESDVTFPNGNSLKLEFTIHDGKLDVNGHYLLASDGVRRPFVAKHYLQADTSRDPAPIVGILLDGTVKGLGPLRMTIPIDDKRGDVYVGQSQEGWSFWTRLIEKAW